MTDRRTRRRVLRVGGAAFVALAGCADSGPVTGTDGEDGTATGSATPTDEGGGHGHGGGELDGPSPSATVAMTTTEQGTHFDPHVAWVEPGGTVTWTLESGSHSTTAYAATNDRPQRIPDGGGAWDSGTLSEQGATFEQSFDAPGVYDYFCVPHEAAGMVGSVVVGRPEASGQPGLEPPQSSLPEGAREKIRSLNERVRAALDGTSSGTTTHGGDGHHGGNATDTAGHHGESTTDGGGHGH